jgi:hypothetical protein
MPTEHIVVLLIQERDRLNRAIEALQGPIKRRGRPPKNAASYAPVLASNSLLNTDGSVAKKKRHVSAASRRKMALAQKKRWAERKKRG